MTIENLLTFHFIQDQNLQQAQPSGRNLQSNKPKDGRPKNQPPPRPPSPKFNEQPQNQRDPQLVRDMAPPAEMSKEQLQSRLQELLGKKDRLDRLIQVRYVTCYVNVVFIVTMVIFKILLLERSH